MIEIPEPGVDLEMLQHLLTKWCRSIVERHFSHLGIQCISHRESGAYGASGLERIEFTKIEGFEGEA